MSHLFTLMSQWALTLYLFRSISVPSDSHFPLSFSLELSMCSDGDNAMLLYAVSLSLRLSHRHTHTRPKQAPIQGIFCLISAHCPLVQGHRVVIGGKNGEFVLELASGLPFFCSFAEVNEFFSNGRCCLMSTALPM